MTDTNTTPALVVVPKYMTQDQAITVLKSFGLQFRGQAGFIRVDGSKGNRLYVANTKSVRRVDISGFEASMSIARSHKLGKFGNVSQEMRLGETAEEAIRNLEALCIELLRQAPKEAAPKAPKAEKVEAKEVDVEKAKIDRMALIKKVAEEMNVQVSSNA